MPDGDTVGSISCLCGNAGYEELFRIRTDLVSDGGGMPWCVLLWEAISGQRESRSLAVPAGSAQSEFCGRLECADIWHQMRSYS